MEIQVSNQQINGPEPLTLNDSLLEESIQRLLSDHRAGLPDFSRFVSIFSRIIHTMTDPPLEFVWFYAIATVRISHCYTVRDPLNQVLATKDLLQFLVSFNYRDRIAVLAPVVFELHALMMDSRFLGFRRDVDCLIEGIVSYISMHCGCDDELAKLGKCFEGVVRVWTVDKVEANVDDFRVCLRAFLPLVSDDVRGEIGEGCGVGHLTGVVMYHVFMSRMCSKFGLAGFSRDSEKEALNWVVNTISGFRNCYFIDILLRMMLVQSLNVFSLLSSEGEVLFRKVLFDAVLLVEHPFFTPRTGIELPGNHLTDLAVAWLFVADKAVQYARENGDENCANSYIHAFADSRLPNQIIEWITNQAGKERIISRPNVTTPVALIKWLLLVEDQGIQISDNGFLSCHARAVSYKSKAISGNETGAKNVDADDEVMVDSVDAVFTTSASTMTPIAIDVTRKRKEASKDNGETRVKFFKVHLHANISEKRGFCL